MSGSVIAVKKSEIKPIVKFMSFSEVRNNDDLERVSATAEEYARLVENGEEEYIPIVDYMLSKIDEYEEAQILKMGVEQPDDVEMVKYFLELKDMTITALAAEVRMSRTVLSEILNRKNNRRFSKKQIGDLAKFFGVKVSVFY